LKALPAGFIESPGERVPTAIEAASS